MTDIIDEIDIVLFREDCLLWIYFQRETSIKRFNGDMFMSDIDFDVPRWKIPFCIPLRYINDIVLGDDREMIELILELYPNVEEGKKIVLTDHEKKMIWGYVSL